MGSWDAFDTYNNSLRLNFPGAAPPNQAWPGGQHNVQMKPQATTSQSGLSLDRYLQLLRLLTGGPNPATGKWIVRSLGELERAAVKMDDLKNVLAINGLIAGSKTKQDVLDKMRGMVLLAPVCSSSPSSLATPAPPDPMLHQNSRDTQTELLEAIQCAMESVDISPALKTAAADSIKHQGFYSFCPLPNTQHPLRAPQNPSWDPRAPRLSPNAFLGSAPRPVPCASTTTIASRPAIPFNFVADSPPGDAIMREEPHEEEVQMHETPEWLLPSLETLLETCQGSQETITGRALIGRKARLFFNSLL